MPSEIADLIRRILAQDESALLELYEQFGGLVYSIAMRVLNDTNSAEEVTQDVFLKVWNKAAQFDIAQASFATWLGRVARNTAIDALRKRQSREPQQGVISLDDNPLVFEQTVAATYSDDQTRLITLQNAINTLPKEQADLIYLAYFGGMSHQDMADHTGLPVGTVKSRIRAGMQKLRDVWEINPILEENS